MGFFNLYTSLVDRVTIIVIMCQCVVTGICTCDLCAWITICGKDSCFTVKQAMTRFYWPAIIDILLLCDWMMKWLMKCSYGNHNLSFVLLMDRLSVMMSLCMTAVQYSLSHIWLLILYVYLCVRVRVCACVRACVRVCACV